MGIVLGHNTMEKCRKQIEKAELEETKVSPNSLEKSTLDSKGEGRKWKPAAQK